MINYEAYPIHVLSSGFIISELDYKRLPSDEKKEFAATNRMRTGFISYDNGRTIWNHFDEKQQAREILKHQNR